MNASPLRLAGRVYLSSFRRALSAELLGLLTLYPPMPNRYVVDYIPPQLFVLTCECE